MTEKLLKQFKEKWGDLYDYSQSKYNGHKEKMKIFCRKHKIWFWQSPECHLKFHGCPDCSKEYKSALRRKSSSDFINECKKIHGDTIIFDDIDYTNNREKITVSCVKHGKFSISPSSLLKGVGCPICRKEKPSSKRLSFDVILKKFKEKYGDKYQYDASTYTKSATKMKMICPIHGEFWKSPNKHLMGQGCPLCSKEKRLMSSKTKISEFIERGNKIHNSAYDYSLVKFDTLSDKIDIICHKKDENGKEHGIFSQMAQSHLRGCGCPKCAQSVRVKKNTLSFEDFLLKAKEIHVDKNYTYDSSTYKNRNTEMRIICPIHGEFWQKPNKHLCGHGCPKCATSGIHLSEEEYIKRANEIHNNKYIYKYIDFHCTKDKIKIICPIHGEFYQEAQSHLQGHGCPKCCGLTSQAEINISTFLKELIGEENVIEHDRNVLNKKEIDILLPSFNIGIEYNGLYWHSEKFGKDKFFHLNKTEEAKLKNIDIIQIFEDEWLYKENIVKSKIKHILGLNYNLPKIMGRNCTIKEITSKDSAEFLENNHIQGKAYATIHIGAFFNNNLIAVMLFKRDGINNGYWELNRYASDINYRCQGVAGKLFKYFIKKYNPYLVKSFADRRWTVNEKQNLYTSIGFKLEEILDPDYKYFINNNSKLERIHKFNFRKQILHRKYGLPLSMTEREMVDKLGIYRIWDCGLFKYVWKKPS